MAGAQAEPLEKEAEPRQMEKEAPKSQMIMSARRRRQGGGAHGATQLWQWQLKLKTGSEWSLTTKPPHAHSHV